MPALSWLGACASRPSNPAPADHATDSYSTAALLALLPQDAILLGEQHDAAEHQSIHQLATQALAERGLLAALVIEMAEAGRSTQGLAPDAQEAQVRQSLAWNERAWSWARYGPAIMAAVRAGIAVHGANLARERMSEAMRDALHDARLAPAALARQQQDIRDGHCGLLPESQIMPMTRVQIARDASMALAAQAQARPGKTVLLLVGAAHAARDTGIPAHWRGSFRAASVRLLPSGSEPSAGLGFDQVWRTAAVPAKDYCADFKRQVAPKQSS